MNSSKNFRKPRTTKKRVRKDGCAGAPIEGQGGARAERGLGKLLLVVVVDIVQLVTEVVVVLKELPNEFGKY